MINGRPTCAPRPGSASSRRSGSSGYRPNTAARALVTRRSATIGVIGSNSGFWGPSSMHRTVQAAGRAAGYFVSSVNLQRPDRARSCATPSTTCATRASRASC